MIRGIFFFAGVPLSLLRRRSSIALTLRPLLFLILIIDSVLVLGSLVVVSGKLIPTGPLVNCLVGFLDIITVVG